MTTSKKAFSTNPNLIFQAISNNSNDYIYSFNLEDHTYLASKNLAEDFNIQQEGNHFEVLWNSCIHPRDIKRVQENVKQILNEKKTKIKMEYQVVTSRGNCIWLSDKATVFYNEKTKEPQSVVGIMHNLSYDGEVDTVTGLLMHTKCKQVYDSIQNRKMRNKGCLMMLGIDEFASINTLNDHTFGDFVLRATTQDILELLPEKTTMYRYDGDQFLIIADKCDKEQIVKLYEVIKEYTSKAHSVMGKTYRFTMSAGIASYPEDANTWFDLEKAVSIALKAAKEKGKNRYAHFTSEMYQEKLYEQSLGRYLADSVEHDFYGFHVVFQPVCYAQSLKIKGAEILLRYENPLKENISPDQFIPLLEQSQLIIPVGLWVMEQAIKTCKEWTKVIEDFVMNVNVSYLQLRDGTFPDKVEHLLKTYDLDVSHIVLELTESYFISDANNINVSMERIHELQLQVAMDDFGTGYSSLARLSQFNVDVVKIDRSFVQSLHKSKFNHDFVDSVVRLCHNIGMKVCVEGVETKEEQESICVLNSDYIQGFYVSKPILKDAFFKKFILQPDVNDILVVIPNMQLRHEQLVADKDVLVAMMDATPLGLSFWNREYEVIACNGELLRMFDVEDLQEFKEKFMAFLPAYQPNGSASMEALKDIIKRAYDGDEVKLYWEDVKLNKELIPSELTAVRIPYLGDYVIALYSRDMREQKQMEEKINRFNIRLKAILDATPLCLNLWNQKFENIMCNKAAVEMFELETYDDYLEGFHKLSPTYQPDGRCSETAAKEYISKAFETGYQKFFWMHCNLKNEKIPSEITLVKIEEFDEDGGSLVAGYTRDIRTQLESETMQLQANERIRAVLDSSPSACILWSEDLTIIDCNQVAIHLLGANDATEIKEQFDSFLPITQPNGDNSLLKKDKIFTEVIKGKRQAFEWVYISKTKEEIPCEVTIVKIPLKNEAIIVAYSRDLRELHHTLELNNRLSKLAYFDLLTGVASRARIIEEVDDAFQATPYEEGFALGLFDIDYFKAVNDTYGHIVGDTVLKKVAKTIESIIPKTALLGRYGGDEFIIGFQHISKQQLEQLMQQIVEEIKDIVFEDHGKQFTTSLSMGASFKTKEDEDYHGLFARADTALYEAKRNGRNGYRIL